MQTSSEQPNPSDAVVEKVAETPFFVKFIATGFYTGYSPIAPGTAGTLAGLAIYLLPSFELPSIVAAAIVAGFLFGVYAGRKLEVTFGHDPTVVVIDEMVGVWISLFLLPKTTLVVLAGFILFRILDTIKPQPAKLFQRQGGGIAIMMDDVIAGVYTNLGLRLIILLLSII
jgi:phosphatidylglycerophosphatase A